MINNPFAEDGIISCQCCDSGEYLFNEDGNRNGYCGNCGARIDWPEDKDGWKKPESEIFAELTLLDSGRFFKVFE